MNDENLHGEENDSSEPDMGNDSDSSGFYRLSADELSNQSEDSTEPTTETESAQDIDLHENLSTEPINDKSSSGENLNEESVDEIRNDSGDLTESETGSEMAAANHAIDESGPEPTGVTIPDDKKTDEESVRTLVEATEVLADSVVGNYESEQVIPVEEEVTEAKTKFSFARLLKFERKKSERKVDSFTLEQGTQSDEGQRINEAAKAVDPAGIDSDTPAHTSHTLSDALEELDPSESNEVPAEDDSSEEKRSNLMQIPHFIEPDWYKVVDMVDSNVEPCDVTGEMVEVSLERRLVRSVERAMAQVRVQVMKRIAQRSEYRFEEKIEQNNALISIQMNLADWHQEHSKSLAWQFNRKSVEQADLATQRRLDAIEAIKSIHADSPDAHAQYWHFMKRTFVPVVLGTYIYSVLLLTDEKLHFILKYFPIFNQNHLILAVIVSGPVLFFVMKAGWHYTTAVRNTHGNYVAAKKSYFEYTSQIDHNYTEESRLKQQLGNISKLLEVLARGYRSRWLSSERLGSIEVSTELDTQKLPACFGFARAVDGTDEQMMQLRDLSIRQVIRPGWRTELIELVAKEYGKKKGQSLDYHKLDSDLGYAEQGPRELFLSSLKDDELTKRLAKRKLFQVVNEIHNAILRQPVTDLRPPVKPTRLNGFEGVSASTAWLSEETDLEEWIEYLNQILKQAPRFSYSGLSAAGRGMKINEGKVYSFAVVPKYLEGAAHESIQTEIDANQIIAPIDIVVRVDVSEWADIEAFEVFDDEVADESHESEVMSRESNYGGLDG